MAEIGEIHGRDGGGDDGENVREQGHPCEVETGESDGILEVNKFVGMMAVASEAQGQAMMWMARVIGETHRRGRTQNGRCVTDDYISQFLPFALLM